MQVNSPEAFQPEPQETTTGTDSRAQAQAQTQTHRFQPVIDGINLLEQARWGTRSVELFSGSAKRHISFGQEVVRHLVDQNTKDQLDQDIGAYNVHVLSIKDAQTPNQPADKTLNDCRKLRLRQINSNDLFGNIAHLETGYWYEFRGLSPNRASQLLLQLPTTQAPNQLLGIHNTLRCALPLSVQLRTDTCPVEALKPFESILLSSSRPGQWQVLAEGSVVERWLSPNPLVRNFPGLVERDGQLSGEFDDSSLFISTNLLSQLSRSRFKNNRVLAVGEPLIAFIHTSLEQSNECSFVLESKKKCHHNAVFLHRDKYKQQITCYCHDTLGSVNCEAKKLKNDLRRALKRAFPDHQMRCTMPRAALQRDYVNCGAVAIENLHIAALWPDLMRQWLSTCADSSKEFTSVPIEQLPAWLLWFCQYPENLSPAQLAETLPWGGTLEDFIDQVTVSVDGVRVNLAGDIIRFRLLNDLHYPKAGVGRFNARLRLKPLAIERPLEPLIVHIDRQSLGSTTQEQSQPDSIEMSVDALDSSPADTSTNMQDVLPNDTQEESEDERPDSLIVNIDLSHFPVPASWHEVSDAAKSQSWTSDLLNYANHRETILRAPDQLHDLSTLKILKPDSEAHMNAISAFCFRKGHICDKVSRLRNNRVPLPAGYPMRKKEWSSPFIRYLAWKRKSPFFLERPTRKLLFAASAVRVDHPDYLHLVARYIQLQITPDKTASTPIPLTDKTMGSLLHRIAFRLNQTTLPKAIEEKGHTSWTWESITETLKQAEMTVVEDKQQPLTKKFRTKLKDRIEESLSPELVGDYLRQLLEQNRVRILKGIARYYEFLQFPPIDGLRQASPVLTRGEILAQILNYGLSPCLPQEEVTITVVFEALELFKQPDSLTGESLNIYKQLLSILQKKTTGRTNDQNLKRMIKKYNLPCPALLQRDWKNLYATRFPEVKWKT